MLLKAYTYRLTHVTCLAILFLCVGAMNHWHSPLQPANPWTGCVKRSAFCYRLLFVTLLCRSATRQSVQTEGRSLIPICCHHCFSCAEPVGSTLASILEKNTMSPIVKDVPFAASDPFPRSYSEKAEVQGAKPLFNPTIVQMDHTSKTSRDCECCTRAEFVPAVCLN